MLKRNLYRAFYISSVLLALPFCCSFAATAQIDGNAVRLRKEPSTDAKIVTLLENDKKIEVLSKESGWFNIKAGENTGWVAENLIKNIEGDINEVKIVNPTEIATSLMVPETSTVGDAANTSDSSDTVVAVTGSNVNLREGPSTQAKIVGKVVEGDNLVVSEKTADELWYKVTFGDLKGYVYAEYVTSDVNKLLGKGTINDTVNFRTKPSTDSEVISKIPVDSNITVTDVSGEWYKVLYNEQEGWIVARCVDRVTSTSRSGTSSVARKVVELAQKQLGKKYVWGANGPNSFDCSGLTKYVFGKVGITLERVSYNQATQGIKVDKSKLQAGDLVFFSGINASSSSAKVSHVGIYVGNGKFVHASNPTRGVVTDELSSEYYSKHYVTARRVIR